MAWPRKLKIDACKHVVCRRSCSKFLSHFRFSITIALTPFPVRDKTETLSAFLSISTGEILRLQGFKLQ